MTTMNKKIPFIDYHVQSSLIRDIDPANDCLLYVAERFELSEEQRYWLAFLYSTCYCAPTVFYIYNEFPDFENVDVGRLQRWWDSNKQKTVFQTDRLRIKTQNKFVETFNSYRNWVGELSQQEAFERIAGPDPVGNYTNAFYELGKIRNVGRFTLFIYLEMISVLTRFKCIPDKIDWKHADNCRIGLNYSVGLVDDMSTKELDEEMARVINHFERTGCEHSNIFNVETTLCAYKKYCHGKRYVGYYIDRQLREIEKMKQNVTTGVAWRVMDEFRIETYNKKNLKEFQHENILNSWGLWSWQNMGDETASKKV